MLVEQLSIFIENRKGSMAEVSGILERAGVRICALLLADTSDFGVLRVIVNNNGVAEAALKENGFIVGKSKVLAIEFEEMPGGLSRFLEPLRNADINIEYMYSFPCIKRQLPIMIFRADNPQKAIEVLKEKQQPILSPEELCS